MASPTLVGLDSGFTVSDDMADIAASMTWLTNWFALTNWLADFLLVGRLAVLSLSVAHFYLLMDR